MERGITKTTVVLAVITAILLFVAGCGPGQPFEIEGLQEESQFSASTLVAAAR